MKILLTGKNGQVGAEILKQVAQIRGFGAASPTLDLLAVGSTDCNLTDRAAVTDLIRRFSPDVLINPAAYTAVDKAESEPELARAVNAHAPDWMAQELKHRGGVLIHFSTDYVFDGCKQGPYKEDDSTNPQSVYGATKLEGEQAIAASGVDHIILRTSWVFGQYGNNFLKTMLRLAAERDQLRVVNDQFGAPTSARFLAQTLISVLGLESKNARVDDLAQLKERCGLYHCSCAGRTNWFEYARFAIEHARSQGAPIRLAPQGLEPIPASQYPTPAARPSNSVLDNEKLRNAFAIVQPQWQTEVSDCMAALK